MCRIKELLLVSDCKHDFLLFHGELKSGVIYIKSLSFSIITCSESAGSLTVEDCFHPESNVSNLHTHQATWAGCIPFCLLLHQNRCESHLSEPPDIL